MSDIRENETFDREHFISEAVWSYHFFTVFENFPDVFFWTKDIKGRFITANKNFLEITHTNSEENLKGKTDYDVWPADLAMEYIKDDNTVIATGKPIIDRIEYITGENGKKSWFTTTKFPIMDKSGSIIGTYGYTRQLRESGDQVNPIMKIVPAINYINRFFNTQINVQEIADEINMTEKEIRHRFMKTFMKPIEEYIKDIRLEAAVNDLINEGISIKDISEKCGFMNESELEKAFFEVKKMTVADFRKMYKQS